MADPWANGTVAAKMGVSPTWVRGSDLPLPKVTSAFFAPGASIAQAVSNPSTFGLAPLTRLLRPARSLPNQVRTSSARALASSPVGLAPSRRLRLWAVRFWAAPAGAMRVIRQTNESPSRVQRDHGVSFV